MTRSVFLSLLALDSYNRGYDESLILTPRGDSDVQNESGRRVGNADILNIDLPAGSVDAGFYAIAYEWNGETIISYRGTDFNGDIVDDIANGWPIGAGVSSAAQADLAVRFYEDVSGVSSIFETPDFGDDPPDREVTLTGHSLGGGLAGFIGSLSFNDVFAFDTMPFFEAAIDYALNAAVDAAIAAASAGLEQSLPLEALTGALAGSSDPDLNARSEVFLSVLLAELAANRPALPGALEGIAFTSQHLEGEVLEIVRALGVDLSGIDVLPALLNAASQRPELTAALALYGVGNATSGVSTAITSASTPNYGIDLSDLDILPNIPPAPLGADLGTIAIANAVIDAPNNTVNLHSASLLTIMLFGEEMWDGEDWRSSIQHIAPAIYDDDVATVLLNRQNLVEGAAFDGLAGDGAKVGTAIAYSVLENTNNEPGFELVFGDTAVRALFDDADDLGKALGGLPEYIGDDELKDIGAVIAEFSGLLAVNRFEQQTWEDAADGIIRADDPEVAISLDLTSGTWSLNENLPQAHPISTAENLGSNLIEAALGFGGGAGLQDALIEFVVTELEDWYLTFNGARLSEIDSVSIGLAPGAGQNVEESRLPLFLLTNSNDEIAFSDGVGGIVVTGNGTDKISFTGQPTPSPVPPTGNAVIGGSGNDDLTGGTGNDWFFGGGGINDIDGGDGTDTAVYADSGALNLTYRGDTSSGSLEVQGNGGARDTLTNLERIRIDAATPTFRLVGNIANGTNLQISSQTDGGTSLGEAILATDARAGQRINLNQAGVPSQITDLDTDGVISFENFNTTIFGSDFDDIIFDGSDEEKTIIGGDGADVISISETLPNSVLIGGEGSNQFIAGHGDDVIIDQRSVPSARVDIELPAFADREFPVLGGAQGGFGDDQIVVDIGGLQPTFFDADGGVTGPNVGAYLLDPGEGNDSIQLNLNGRVQYRYERGDGADRIAMQSFGEFGLSDDFNVFPEITLYQSRFSFDLSDYSRDEVTIRFGAETSQVILRDAPNFDFGSLSAAQGNLVIEFGDGGSILVEDVFAAVSGEFEGFVGVFGNYTFEFADGIFSSFEDTLVVEPVVEFVGGPIGAPPAPSSPTPPSQVSQGSDDPEASAPSEPLDDLSSLSGSFGPQTISQSGGEASASQQPVVPQAVASPLMAIDDDQEFTLERGNFSYVGGLGVDRLVVAWTLDALVVSHQNNELTISDRWGVLGTTTLTDFDEIQVLETDTVYTVQGLLDAVAARQFSEPLIGTEEADTLEGTQSRDRISGLGDNDTINGLAGDDIIDAGAGDDVVDGSQGDDELLGNEGQDTLRGGEGDDLLDGGTGDDFLEGGTGDDTYVVDSAGDVVIEQSDSGIDRVIASIDYALADHLEELTLTGDGLSGTGNDGNNRLQSIGAGSTLAGLAGSDLLLGGDGDDILVGGSGSDQIAGNGGDDTASYEGSSAGVDIDLASGTATGGDAAGDTLSSIENLIGSDHTDTLTGDAINNFLAGALGDDTLIGGAGDDTLTGGQGNDTLNGGLGVDTASYQGSSAGIVVDLASGTATGGDASGDTLSSIENLIGSDHSDVLTGDANDNVLIGGLGDDAFDGDEGSDTIRYSGLSSEYTIDLDNGTIRHDATNETDSFTDVEFAEFADLTVRINDAPVEVLAGLTDQVLEDDERFAYFIPTDAFSDPDGDQTDPYLGLSFDVGLSNGDPLPSWLSFDPDSKDFFYRGSGAPVGSAITIRVTASDESSSATAFFTLSVVEGAADPIIGTSGDDTLSGTSGADVINGLGGNDVIQGLDEADVLDGGSGEDEIFGGAGNDDIRGAGGDDTINGDEGNDLIRGNRGRDIINGGQGDDEIGGGRDDDTLSGGEGNDEIRGGGGNDFLNGDDGNDLLSGNQGQDEIDGGVGDDILRGGGDNDTLFGGEGIDTLRGGEGSDLFRLDASGTASDADTVIDFTATDDQVEVIEAGGKAIAFAQAGNDTELRADGVLIATLQNANVDDVFAVTTFDALPASASIDTPLAMLNSFTQAEPMFGTESSTFFDAAETASISVTATKVDSPQPIGEADPSLGDIKLQSDFVGATALAPKKSDRPVPLDQVFSRLLGGSDHSVNELFDEFDLARTSNHDTKTLRPNGRIGLYVANNPGEDDALARSNADVARRLMMIRQDMSAFGVADGLDPMRDDRDAGLMPMDYFA